MRAKFPLEITMLLRGFPESGMFSPRQYFEGCALPFPLEFENGGTTAEDMLFDTMVMAQRHQDDVGLQIICYEGFFIDAKNRMPMRHIWIQVGGRHVSLQRKDCSTPKQAWGVPIPSLAIGLCTMKGLPPTPKLCLEMIPGLPSEEQTELAWMIGQAKTLA